MLRHNFRELQPVELWSARLDFTMPFDDFQARVAELAAEHGERISGFTTQNEGEVTTFTRTRYPRRKYGIPEIEEISASTDELAKRLNGATIVDETRIIENLFRVVLGLQEGYGEGTRLHTIDEVHRLIGGTSLRATPAEVFAVRADGVSYTEPCAVLEGDPIDRRIAYDLADEFKQERFTIEDFSTQLAGVVETRHCTTPDPE